MGNLQGTGVIVQGTREIPIADLTRFPGNPRRGNTAEIRKSVRRLGQYRTIVVRDTGDALVILAGNHTTDALAAEGHATVRGEIITCTDDEARRINLADNRLAELGGYDDDDLAAMLVGLDGDFDGTGWAQDDLDELLAEPSAGNGDPDAIPDPPADPVTRPGDLWLLGQHRILCGDSTSPGDVVRLMNGKRARLMATDPPYLVDYDGSNHPQSTVNSAMTKDKAWDDYKDPTTGAAFFTAFIAVALEHALTPAPVVYQWHADMRRGLVVEGWERNGLLPHQTVIWVKSRPVLTRSDFMWQHEPCLYGWVKGNRPDTAQRPPANETTIWKADKQGASNDIHPTEKPVELFTRPIGWHTRPGEVVYEPFSGSGTQIIAAHTLGRACYAMEIAPQYVDVAVERFREFTGDEPERIPADG